MIVYIAICSTNTVVLDMKHETRVGSNLLFIPFARRVDPFLKIRKNTSLFHEYRTVRKEGVEEF